MNLNGKLKVLQWIQSVITFRSMPTSEGWSWEEDGMFGHKFYKDGKELVN